MEDEHDLAHCLQETCKIESRIAQCKLLGLKSVQYNSIGERGRPKKKKKFKDFKPRSQSRSQSTGWIKDCKYFVSNHACRQGPVYGKVCKIYGNRNQFAKKCHSKGNSTGVSKHKSFKYREVNVDQESSDNCQIDDITSKVKSMYYHDVHFNSVNTRMHINVNMRSCNGNTMKTHFRVDTGADGNLLSLVDLFKNFPDANLHELARTVDPYTKLYAYNQIEMKQLGVCELMVEYQSKRKICAFYVVDFPTAILGIHDSESLRLITVHFNNIDAEISQAEPTLNIKPTGSATPMYVNAIQGDDDEFSVKIKHDYSDLFTDIGNMNNTIDIKLKEGIIPYVAPIQRLAHALQEPL